MTTTPTPWNALAPVQKGTGTLQNDASIVALADGGYLVSWTDNSDNDARQLLGQRYDVLGHKVGGPIDLDSYASGDNSDGTMVAMRDGGVALAFTHFDGGTVQVLVHRYDAALDSVTTDTIAEGYHPSIASFAEGGYVVVHGLFESGGIHIFARVVSADGAVSAPITIDASGPDQAPRVAVLSNGNFVTAYDSSNNNGDVHFQVRNRAGDLIVADAAVAGAGTDNTAVHEGHNDVAALRNGGFVVAWDDSNGDASEYGIRATVYTNAGAVVASDFRVNTTQVFSQFSPFITPLSDGGFIVNWEDRGGNLTRGQRFDAHGRQLGVEFALQHNPDDQNASRAVEINDGRVAYALGHFTNFGEDINTEVLDPRTSPINGTAAADILTSRIDGATVNGLRGDDTIYGGSGIDHLNGGKGGDKAYGGKGDDVLRGKDGGDTLYGGAGADRMHAGSDNDKDTLVFTAKHDSGHDKHEAGWDHIFQFDAKSGHESVYDRIDVSAIDADKGADGDQAFRFVNQFSKALGTEPVGEVMVQEAGRNVKILVDVNGDKDADMILLVIHVHDLHKADFIL